jgi:hypothetical protein
LLYVARTWSGWCRQKGAEKFNTMTAGNQQKLMKYDDKLLFHFVYVADIINYIVLDEFNV